MSGWSLIALLSLCASCERQKRQENRKREQRAHLVAPPQREPREEGVHNFIFSIDISDKPRTKKNFRPRDRRNARMRHSLVTAQGATMSLGSQTDLPGMLGSEPLPGFPAPEWSGNDDLTVSLLQAPPYRAWRLSWGFCLIVRGGLGREAARRPLSQPGRRSLRAEQSCAATVGGFVYFSLRNIDAKLFRAGGVRMPAGVRVQ
jgi:hypothetical protein